MIFALQLSAAVLSPGCRRPREWITAGWFQTSGAMVSQFPITGLKFHFWSSLVISGHRSPPALPFLAGGPWIPPGFFQPLPPLMNRSPGPKKGWFYWITVLTRVGIHRYYQRSQ